MDFLRLSEIYSMVLNHNEILYSLVDYLGEIWRQLTMNYLDLLMIHWIFASLLKNEMSVMIENMFN
jgi:diketogulonate reductase-like aldo/keto reductase